ncbi:MAG: SPOR domain-containing protein [Betaproteobacteria bacterium]
MRTLFALLLVANIAFFAYTEFDRMREGESSRLKRQIAPERIKLLSPQQVAALGPAKAAQLANVCLEWGAFTEHEKAAALAALEPLQLGKQLSQRRIESASAYWVYVPPLTSKIAADRKVAELRNQGLKDFFILVDGPQKNAISLGVFKTEDTANKFLDNVKSLGATTARSGARAQNIQQTLFVLRDPQPAQAERMQVLKAEFAGSEVKIGSCDGT